MIYTAQLLTTGKRIMFGSLCQDPLASGTDTQAQLTEQVELGESLHNSSQSFFLQMRNCARVLSGGCNLQSNISPRALKLEPDTVLSNISHCLVFLVVATSTRGCTQHQTLQPCLKPLSPRALPDVVLDALTLPSRTGRWLY